MIQETASSGLKRDIGLPSALSLVVANMVGSGIFTTAGFIMGELGSGPALMACWLAGGLFALSGALCYGELGSRFPRAGGEYAYLMEAFGPLPAFLSGWISLIVGFSAPIAAAAIAFATYLTGGNTAPWFTLEAFGYKVLSLSFSSGLACLAVAVLSLVHCRSLTLSKRVQNGLTLFKLVLILGFIIAGFWVGRGNWGHFTETFRQAPADAGGFAVALIFVSFAYSGWNAAAYLGGEIKRPSRNLPLALILGTAAVTVLYLLLNLVFVYALPPDRMQGALDVGARAASALFGKGAGTLFGIAIALGLLSVMSAMIMAGPRVYFAMARDGLFFSSLAQIHRSRQTPSRAILFQGGVAIAMILMAAYDQLLIYMGFTLSLSATLTVAGLLRIRRRSPAPLAYRCPGFPLIPLFFISGNLWIVFYSVSSRPMAALLGLLTILAGVGLYWGFCRQRGKECGGITVRI